MKNKEWCEKYSKTKKGLTARIYANQRKTSKKRGHCMPKYDLKEMREWVFKQTDFEKLYKNWKDSNYDRMLSPSIDRIDDKKGYSFSNIQLMTWGENNKKPRTNCKERYDSADK